MQLVSFANHSNLGRDHVHTKNDSSVLQIPGSKIGEQMERIALGNSAQLINVNHDAADARFKV
jgi:hypothetical protein